MDFMQKICSLIDRFQMIKPGDLVLAGVSGGVDSVTLLHILWSLRETRGFSLQVVHLNHCIRGAAADADASLVHELSNSLGLPLISECIDVPAYRAKTGLSLEEAARKVRYCFFEQAARRTGAARVALGHHADDQAETILFNLLRGTGLTGLKGIPPVRGKYIRPLLDVRRREIAAYCRRYHLPFREDASNQETTYTRNRIRLQLIPALERDYNPRLVDALVRLGYVCRDEDAYLEEQTAVLYAALKGRENNNAVTLAVGGLLAAPLPLRRRVLRRAWRELTGAGTDLSYGHVESLLQMLDNPAGGRVTVLPGEVNAVRQGGALHLYHKSGKSLPVPAYIYPLTVPGKTYIPETNLTVRAELVPFDRAPRPETLPEYAVLLDWEKLTGPLYVRRRRQGDRFTPLGMKEAVRLKKFLNGCHVEHKKRDRLPLVVCGDDIVWVGGVRPGELCKVTPSTKECLYLEILEGRTL